MPLRIVLLLISLLFAAPANAEDYTNASLDNFAHTMVRFKSVDVKDDALLDEFAMITDCDLFETFYQNDFKWSQVRAIIRDSIQMKIDTYPTKYHYDAELQLDRYDFKDKNFRFTPGTMVRGVNTFNYRFISKADAPQCSDRKLKVFPAAYDMVIGAPVTISGIPLEEKDAKPLLQRLENAGNVDRIIYTRFNMTVMHIDPVTKPASDMASSTYIQKGTINGQDVRIDARLDSVQFYEDPKLTKLIYTYLP